MSRPSVTDVKITEVNCIEATLWITPNTSEDSVLYSDHNFFQIWFPALAACLSKCSFTREERVAQELSHGGVLEWALAQYNIKEVLCAIRMEFLFEPIDDILKDKVLTVLNPLLAELLQSAQAS